MHGQIQVSLIFIKWFTVITILEHLYLEPLHRLIENIGKILKEEKHKFSKESNKFYTALDKNLHLNTVLPI